MSRMSNLPEVRGRTVTGVPTGTPVPAPTLNVPAGAEIVVKAGRNNTGVISVAESSANALNSSANNFDLLPNQSISLQVLNSNMIWFDSTVSGDTARLIFEFSPES